MVHKRQPGQLCQLELYREPVPLSERNEREDGRSSSRRKQEFSGSFVSPRIQAITSVHDGVQGQQIHH